MALTYGKVPHPDFIDRYIPDEQTGAWNDLGPRVPVGVCRHTMVGTLWGTDKWFRFDPDTNRWPSGLTDYGVGGSTDGEYDGVLLRWNNPRGIRSGWANGGSDGLEGDGIPFVRVMGVNGINRNLVSIERSDGGLPYTQLMSDKQFETIAQLEAYWMDQARVPHTTYPRNPNVFNAQYKDGIITDLHHLEFAIKGCPWKPVIDEVIRFQARVREILKQWQGDASTDPVPPSIPAGDIWPNGWTTEQLIDRFGEMPRIDLRKGLSGMVTSVLTFNPQGVVSNAWVKRAADAGITDYKRIPMPSHLTVTASKDGVSSETVIIPRSGYPDWVLFKGDGNAGWMWLR